MPANSVSKYTLSVDELGDIHFKILTGVSSMIAPLEEISIHTMWTSDMLPSIQVVIYTIQLTRSEAVILLMDHAIQQLELQMINASKLRQIIQQKKETAVAKVLGQDG